MTDPSALSVPTATPDFLPHAYVQGQFVPFAEAKISIATHALHYGTAVLGGIRGVPDPNQSDRMFLFRLADHSRRLSQSAKYLGYEIAPAEIEARLIECVQRNRPQCSFYLRPLIYTAGLGVAPRCHQIEKDLLIYGLPMGDYLKAGGVRCRISSWMRQCDRSQPLRAKTSAGYIVSALAKTEAIAAGFDEAILMNAQGKVSEASGMNIFMVRNGHLITPSVDQDILEGITRHSLLTLAQDLGIPTQERPVDKSELFIADEVLLCGTAAQIAPVLSIETYSLPPERPITQQLQIQLQRVMQGQDTQYSHWLTPISSASR